MRYSIKDLETISGIKAHTIRAWELRYNIFTPLRNSNNTRLYTADELKFLLNLTFLNRKGFKISHLCKYNSTEIAKKVVEHFPIADNRDVIFHHWLLATLEFDELLFEKVLSECIREKGLESTLIESLFPFMQKIGNLWHAGFVSSSQEHFMTNLIRRKIIGAIDSLPLSSVGTGKQFLLFLPEGEWHELVLLFSYYLIKRRDHKVIYLGQSVPWEDIANLRNVKDIDFIVSVITYPQMDESIEDYLIKLCSHFNLSNILIAGQYAGVDGFSSAVNVNFINGPDDLLKFI